MTEEKKSIENEIQAALAINIDNIAEELANQPSTYYYYSCSWAMASRRRRQVQMQKKELEARLSKKFRELMKEEDKSVRLTNKMIEDFMFEQPEYQEAEKVEIQAQYIEDMLEVARDGFKQRAQMINELSRSHSDERFYGNEFKVMSDELTARDERKAKKRSKRTTTQEVTNEQ